MRDGGIAAVTCWLLTKVVETDCPFQRRVVEEAKFDPLTVSVKPFPAAITLAGDKEPNTGVALVLGELASLPPPHPAKAIATLISTTAASVVFCLIRCMTASSVSSSIVDLPESADIGAKWLAGQWWGYGLYVFWF